jgi:hypothetical protein
MRIDSRETTAHYGPEEARASEIKIAPHGSIKVWREEEVKRNGEKIQYSTAVMIFTLGMSEKGNGMGGIMGMVFIR